MSDPRIFTTAEWGATAVSSVFAKRPSRGIVVHNTESANRAPHTDFDQEKTAAFALARRIQQDHFARNFADTGQHFTISRGGIIMEGRHGSLTAARTGEVVKGAHACGDPTFNGQWFGIEIEGDNRNRDQVTDEQFAALVELCSWLCLWGGVDSSKILPHREVRTGCTDCPGEFANRVDELKQAVHNRKLELMNGEERAGATNTIVITGKMSTFGGPGDSGVGPGEGLALVSTANLHLVEEFFLDQQPPGTTGLARRLNPETFYLACRWDYTRTPPAHLIRTLVTVRNPANGKSAQAKPVDFGPALRTGRRADLSPGLAAELGLDTDDVCVVTIPLP